MSPDSSRDAWRNKIEVLRGTFLSYTDQIISGDGLFPDYGSIPNFAETALSSPKMGLLDFDYHPSLRATITLPIAKDDTMKNRNISLSGFCLMIASFATLTGCEYEEDDVHSQAEPETNMIQQPQQKRSSGTDFANTPNSSQNA